MNVKEVVPFLRVAEMERSLRFYVDGLGFAMTKSWTPEGRVLWCWLESGSESMMLQEIYKEGHHAWKPEGKLGLGVSVVFICEDALAIYREVRSRGVDATEPEVGNAMWAFHVTDP